MDVEPRCVCAPGTVLGLPAMPNPSCPRHGVTRPSPQMYRPAAESNGDGLADGSGSTGVPEPDGIAQESDSDIESRDGDSSPVDCDCRPRWAGHECTKFTAAEQSMSDYLHADSGLTVLYDDEVKEAVAAAKPGLWLELADQIEPVYPEAARLIRSVVRDMKEDPGD